MLLLAPTYVNICVSVHGVCVFACCDWYLGAVIKCTSYFLWHKVLLTTMNRHGGLRQHSSAVTKVQLNPQGCWMINEIVYLKSNSFFSRERPYINSQCSKFSIPQVNRKGGGSADCLKVIDS